MRSIDEREKYVTMNGYLSKEDIDQCVKDSKIYRGEPLNIESDPNKLKLTWITLSDNTSDKEARSIVPKRKNKKDKTNPDTTAILNFADFRYPGGLYLKGSTAQEESLCDSSLLYNILTEFKDTYYKENKSADQRHGLYQNAAIYTKDVPFYLRTPKAFKCDVITCAAPNVTKYLKNKNCTYKDAYDEIDNAIRSRIDFVLSIAADNKVDNLILGAYGCGVFGCDPRHVATVFTEIINDKYIGVFKNIYFPIPDITSVNYCRFRGAFRNCHIPGWNYIEM